MWLVQFSRPDCYGRVKFHVHKFPLEDAAKRYAQWVELLSGVVSVWVGQDL